MCVCVYVSVRPSVGPSVCLCVSLGVPACLLVCQSGYLSVCTKVCGASGVQRRLCLRVLFVSPAVLLVIVPTKPGYGSV